MNYFPNDDDTKKPLHSWKTTAHLFYHNWLNAVYQLTPYDLKGLDK
ncbi:homoserine O-succinyltransferase [uncultured Fusobacterium sp.]|nr:homoserine O-succinyltransferase [uncultured Fusobacterium sp.]